MDKERGIIGFIIVGLVIVYIVLAIAVGKTQDYVKADETNTELFFPIVKAEYYVPDVRSGSLVELEIKGCRYLVFINSKNTMTEIEHLGNCINH